jgi:hypothetical protein
MSRQQFTNRNNINSVLTFQKSGATTSFDPSVGFSSGSRRVSWKLDNGSETTQTAGNSITYTGFTSDTGIRKIQMKGNSFRGITGLSLDNENLYGHIDLSRLNNWGSNGTLQLFTNPNLIGITNPNITSVQLNNYQIQSTGFVGNLDMTPITANISTFNVSNNPNLTGITHNTTSRVIGSYTANNCNLIGNLNLPYTGMSGTLQVQLNPNLTGITHSSSSQNITTYQANNCNLKGTLDLTPLSGLGGTFTVTANSGLTSITHSVSTRSFTTYTASSCKLTGNLDLTPLSGLGGVFQVHNNTLLTGITHSISPNNFTTYQADNCNLTGTLDLSQLTKLGGPTSATTGNVILLNNTSLTNIIFPTSTQFFRNSSNGSGYRVFSLYNCNLDYVDFTPLSGATIVSGSTQGRATIELQNNNMSTADVNHILVDFATIATNNHPRWSEITLNIGGTNQDPDSSSGGYNGLTAITTLTGSPYNWIITTS